jgi:predicted metal-dependent enzyme (double-stranded beta helix superfamily)
MIDTLIRACAAHAPHVRDIHGVARLIRDVAPVVRGVRVARGPLPWGRYLLHAEPGWNLQLDIFSEGYVGGVHGHGTWGAFFVIQGALWSETWDVGLEGGRVVGTSYVPEGGAEGFHPPDSDWHRVGAAPGPQPVSIHLYGPYFNMEEGDGLGPDGRMRTYKRGAWGNLDAVRDALVAR